MQFLWKYIDELVGKGLDWQIITELIFYASAGLVPLALPLAILLSSIMTFGNLGEHYELVALKSAGISLQRIMFPLMIFIALTSLGAFYFSNNLLPRANLKSATLLYDIRQKKPAIDLGDGAFYEDIEGFVIRVARKDKETDELYDVIIYDHVEKKGNLKVIRAERGKMEISADKRYLIFSLYNGYSYEEMEGNNMPHLRTVFQEDIIRFDLSSFGFNRSDEDLFKNSYRMMNIVQLKAGVDTLRREKNTVSQKLSDRFISAQEILSDSNNNIITSNTDSLIANNYPFSGFSNSELNLIHTNAQSELRRNKSLLSSTIKIQQSKDQMIIKYIIEWHRKFTLSIACIVLFFIGAPLGAIIRKGGLGSPVIISTLFFLVFHVLSITGEKIVKQGNMDPVLGMWMATAILFPVGVFLTYKATTDSPILERDAYNRLYNLVQSRLNNWFNRKKNIE